MPEESSSAAGSIFQINVSSGGIPKSSVSSGQVTADGLEGDGHANPRLHGGPRQALLLITLEGIEELAALGYAVRPGVLGENLTTRGLDRRALRLGQRLRIGSSAIIELTKIRVPCRTLDPLGAGIQGAMYDNRVKGGDVSSPLWGLSGFYASVLEPGTIHPGDSVVPA